MWFDALSRIVSPIAGVFTAKTKRKQANEEGLNKIRQAKVDGTNALNLTDAEWEAVNASAQDGTWKDEYVTVTVTAWIWIGLLGAIMSAYGKPEVLNGVKIFVALCTENNIDLGLLTTMAVGSALGLKLWRGR